MPQDLHRGSSNAHGAVQSRPFHFQDFPEVHLAGMRFTNTEEILRHERAPLAYLVKRTTLGWTLEIAIYNSRGLFVARTSGIEVIGGIEAKKAGLVVEFHDQIAKCTLGGKLIWEIIGDAGHLRIGLSIHTPGGAHLEMPEPGAPAGKLLAPTLGRPTDHVTACRTGIWTRDDGTYELGIPH